MFVGDCDSVLHNIIIITGNISVKFYTRHKQSVCCNRTEVNRSKAAKLQFFFFFAKIKACNLENANPNQVRSCHFVSAHSLIKSTHILLHPDFKESVMSILRKELECKYILHQISLSFCMSN